MSFDELVANADRAAQRALGGVLVMYTPENGEPVQVTGIFDERFVLVTGSAEAAVEATGPAVFLRLEDLPVHPDDDEPTLTIRGLAYRVAGRHPDGIGGIVLELRRT